MNVESLRESKPDKKVALVLSGGGARGSYQIGVWKAMAELGIKIDIVTGISVGSLNGAFVMQEDLEKAIDMWTSISTSDVIEYDMEDIQSFKDYTKHLSSLVMKAFKEGGINTSPLRNLLDNFLNDEESLHASPIDFGVAVTNSETGEVEEYFINDLPRDRIKKLLAASASLFPILEKTSIDDQDYIDGGYRNHVPLALAQTKNPDFTVVVDLLPEKNVDLDLDPDQSIYLESTWPLGDMLLFDHERSKRNIHLGYNDFMKALGKYDGYHYTFSDSGESLKDLLNKDQVNQIDGYGYSMFLKLLEDNQERIQEKVSDKWGECVTEANLHLALLELAGRIFALKPEEIYSTAEFTHQLLDRVRELYNMDDKKSPQSDDPEFYLGYREWYSYFSRKFAILPEQDRIFRFIKQFQKNEDDLSQFSQQIAFKLDPVMYLIARYLVLLSENEKILIHDF